jgi:hypothetical protein
MGATSGRNGRFGFTFDFSYQSASTGVYFLKVTITIMESSADFRNQKPMYIGISRQETFSEEGGNENLSLVYVYFQQKITLR